jgi:hypothetical protein
MPTAAAFRELVETVSRRLEAIPPGQAATRPAPGKWSPKEELGHLLDSAVNNHQRLVRAQLAEQPALPGYEQQSWVAVHHYQERDWRELIGLWRAFNQQLLAVAEALPEAGWRRTCTVADSEPLTLAFIFDDYVDHMLHHLRHIGVRVEDLAAFPSGGLRR